MASSPTEETSEQPDLVSRQTKRRALIAAAIAAAIAGLLIALLAGGGRGSSHRASPNTGAGAGPAAAAASYLGLSRPQLRQELQQGKSLSAIASDQGKSRQGLIEALTRHRVEVLAKQRASGAITPAQERARLAALRARVAAVVERNLRAGGLSRRDLVAAAGYLGSSAAHLGAEVSAGRSLSQIAQATPGRSTAGIVHAVATSRRRLLAAETASGRISKSEEAVLLRSVRRRVVAAVNRSGSNAVPAKR